MSNIIKFTSFATDCNLLQINNTLILIDTIFNNNDSIERINNIIKDVKIILITHLNNIKNLPLLIKLGFNGYIYTTTPIKSLSKLYFYKNYKQLKFNTPFNNAYAYSLSHINTALDLIKEVKYSESIIIDSIVIHALPAGHSLGGALWKLKNIDDILYLGSFNHRKERVLNGALLQRAGIVITPAIERSEINRQQRDAKLLQLLLNTLKRDASVLIPVDYTRVFELAVLLDQVWRYQQLEYKLYWVVSGRVVDLVRSMLEWQGDMAVKTFSQTRESLFDFKKLEVVESVVDLRNCVILASDDVFSVGSDSALLLERMNKEENMLLQVQQSTPDRLSRIDWEKEEFSAEEKQEMQARKIEKKKEEMKQQLMIERQQRMIEMDTENDENAAAEMEAELYFYLDNYDSSEGGGVYPFHYDAEMTDYGTALRDDEFVNTLLEEHKKRLLSTKLYTSGSASGGSGEDDMIDEMEVSWKFKEVRKDVEIKMEIHRLDYDGLVDSNSLITLLKSIQAKKIVVIGGIESGSEMVVEGEVATTTTSTTTTTTNLTSFDNITKDIFTPLPNQEINLSSMDSYPVKISDQLLQSLQIKTYNDTEVAYIRARIRDSTLEPVEYHNHDSITLGDIKLTDLKRILQQQYGYQVDFERGCLVVNREIRIMKNPLCVEGGASKEYYNVRDIVNSLVATI